MLISGGLAVLLGCAAQGPPSGGPEDKTGPALLSSIPADGSVNVSRQTDIVLLFSENVDPRSAENSLEMTPALPQLPVVKVNRRRIAIECPEPLAENTTYIISFGRSIRDYQNNYSERNIRLAFSTGDSIDGGSISGRVFDIPQKHKPQVWAFRRADGFPDSLLGHQPDYRTAVEPDGSFRLSNLARGVYRLLAISAETAKIILIDEHCLFGLPALDPIDIRSRDASVSGVNFRLSRFYLKPFRLLKVSPLEDKLGLLFSYPVEWKSHPHADIRIDNDAQIQSFWLDYADPKLLLVKARGMVPGQEYSLTVDSLFDDQGNEISASATAIFVYETGEDTTAPNIAATIPANGAKNIPQDTDIRIFFDEAVRLEMTDSTAMIVDKDSNRVEFEYRQDDANSMRLIPLLPLASATEYCLQLDCSSWTDLSGNSFEDSLFSISFQTVDANSFGSISGRVAITDSLASRVMLSCVPVRENEPAVSVPVPESGEYLIESLLPGDYRFEIWEDRNGNGRWDPGRLKPFQAAEPYRSFSEKIGVRARWETIEVNWRY
ncbi:MAG: Ig-like domain-containing protein [Fidelibacterota bacterium]